MVGKQPSCVNNEGGTIKSQQRTNETEIFQYALTYKRSRTNAKREA